MQKFDPVEWNFIELKGLKHPSQPTWYEYKNNPVVDGTHDFLRINLYLSKDGQYVTVFCGLLEPWVVSSLLTEKGIEIPDIKEFSFGDTYNQDLFKGYIDSKETAECIFKAIRLTSYVRAQFLDRDANNRLACKIVGE